MQVNDDMFINLLLIYIYRIKKKKLHTFIVVISFPWHQYKVRGIPAEVAGVGQIQNQHGGDAGFLTCTAGRSLRFQHNLHHEHSDQFVLILFRLTSLKKLLSQQKLE